LISKSLYTENLEGQCSTSGRRTAQEIGEGEKKDKKLMKMFQPLLQ
jgi:hypothetical protein